MFQFNFGYLLHSQGTGNGWAVAQPPGGHSSSSTAAGENPCPAPGGPTNTYPGAGGHHHQVYGGTEGVHVCMCAWVHGCMCAWVHVCMCACVHGCMCACVYVCMGACVHGCMGACVHGCMCALGTHPAGDFVHVGLPGGVVH